MCPDIVRCVGVRSVASSAAEIVELAVAFSEKQSTFCEDGCDGNGSGFPVCAGFRDVCLWPFTAFNRNRYKVVPFLSRSLATLQISQLADSTCYLPLDVPSINSRRRS